MSYKDEIANIREPELVAIFDDLNKRFFNGELPLPHALAWDYRHNRSGGSIFCNKAGNVCYYIVVRGKQKDNPKHVEETMLHEMVHLSLYWRFYNTDLGSLHYRIDDFTSDKSSSFILEGARISAEYGCSFKTFQSWSDENSPDKDTSITKKKYSELNSAKTLLGSLS